MCHATYYIYKDCIHSTPHHPYPEFNSLDDPRRAPLPPAAKPAQPERRPNLAISHPDRPPVNLDDLPPCISSFEDWSSDEEEKQRHKKKSGPVPPPKDGSPSTPRSRKFSNTLKRTRTSSNTTTPPIKRTSPVDIVKAKLSALFTTPTAASPFATSSSPPRHDEEGVTVDPVTGAAITKCWFMPYNPAKHCPSGLTRKEILLPGKCKRCLGRDATLLRLEGPDGSIFLCSAKEKEWLEKMAAIQARERLGLPPLETEPEGN